MALMTTVVMYPGHESNFCVLYIYQLSVVFELVVLLWFKYLHLSDVCVSPILMVEQKCYLKEERSHRSEEKQNYTQSIVACTQYSNHWVILKTSDQYILVYM